MCNLSAVVRNDRQVFRYQVDFGGCERDVVSLLKPDWVFQHGLHPEAVMAVVREGADPDVLAPADVHENGPFLRLLSRVIFESIDQCGFLRREAEIQGSGYVYLLDERTPDPGGRVNLTRTTSSVRLKSVTAIRWLAPTSTIHATGCSQRPDGSGCRVRLRQRCRAAYAPEPMISQLEEGALFSVRPVHVAHSRSAPDAAEEDAQRSGTEGAVGRAMPPGPADVRNGAHAPAGRLPRRSPLLARIPRSEDAPAPLRG